MSDNLTIKSKYSWMKHIDFIILDLFCLVVAGVVAYFVYLYGKEEIVAERWAGILLVSCLIDMMLNLFLNTYSGVLKRPGYMVTVNTIKQTIYIFFLNAAIFYALKIGNAFSRVTVIVSLLTYCVISSILKTILRSYLTKKFQKARIADCGIVLVTDRPVSESFIKDIEVGDGFTYRVKAVYEVDTEGSHVDGIINISSAEELINVCTEKGINNIFVSSSSNIKEYIPTKILLDNGIAIHYDIEELIGVEADTQKISSVGSYRTIDIQRHSFTIQQLTYIRFKRLCDVIIGVLGCLVLAVTAVIIKIIYMLHKDTSPIIYTQLRVGEAGKLIKIYKFRTMVPDAEEMLQELLKDSAIKAEWDENQKLKRDPRITPMGQILRKTSMDELPQFINVLNGTMSFIGPRPLVPNELEMHNGLQLYNKVKPGITGWWACNGRSNIEYKERLELEYYYVNNISLSLDLTCVLRTVKAVLYKQGVH